ncbi:hypothetical protein AB5I41_11260 [Sphingomonas sp. MMS24-JH45]
MTTSTATCRRPGPSRASTPTWPDLGRQGDHLAPAGELRRVGADGSGTSVIPFRVSDTRVVAEATHPAVEVAPTASSRRCPRWASVSPTGAAWCSRRWAASGQARDRRHRTAADARRQDGIVPSWSRDGQQDRLESAEQLTTLLGAIRTIAAGGGSAKAVTNVPGLCPAALTRRTASRVVFEQGQGGELTAARQYRQRRLWCRGDRRRAGAGGEGRGGAAVGRSIRPHLHDRRQQDKRQLVAPGPERRQVHATRSAGVNDFQIAPKGGTVAFARTARRS